MRQTIYRIVCIIAITLLAFGLRMYAANNLLIDGDESTYINAALDYADAIRARDWKTIAWYDYNKEHPALYKILYGVALLSKPPLYHLSAEIYPDYVPIAGTEGRTWGIVGRYVSAVLGTLTVLVLGLLNPVAGLLLAIHSFAVRFTSGFLLESLPLLTSLLSALFYLRWFRSVEEGAGDRPRDTLWLLMSAAALGATAASKYNYAVVGFAISLHYVWFAARGGKLRTSLEWMVTWGVLAILAFVALDPYLWPKPILRLAQSFNFHVEYAKNDWVRGYPVWQPLVWLTSTYPGKFPKFEAAFWVAIDPLITALAVIGLPRTWKRRPLYVIWLVVGLITLFLWRTKWPQYTLILLAPLCMAAAEGAAWIWDWVRKLWARKHTPSVETENRPVTDRG